MGKLLIIVGLALVLIGLIIQFYGKIPYLGKLPGDIRIERENFKFYFPITSSIIISLLISLVLLLVQRLRQ